MEIKIKEYEQAPGNVSIGAIKWQKKWDVCITCNSIEEARGLKSWLEKEASEIWTSDDTAYRPNGLAQPESEPVVWMYQNKSTNEVRFQKHMRDFVDHGQTYETPLYAREWVSPLKDNMNTKYNPTENNADYERGFIDGMQKQMQSSVDKAVNSIAKPESEPVAWRVHPFDYGIGYEGVHAMTARLDQVEAWKRKNWSVEPLYTAPPQREWQGLETDGESQEIWLKVMEETKDKRHLPVLEFAVAIEAKLKEKNGG